MLKSVTPQPCKPGDAIVLRGEGLGVRATSYCQTRAAPKTNERFNTTSVTGAEVRGIVPPDAVSGEVWLTSNSGTKSNRLPFAVGSQPPPNPEPQPVPVPTLAGFTGTTIAATVNAGAEFGLAGTGFTTEAVVSWNGTPLAVLEVRAKAPAAAGPRDGRHRSREARTGRKNPHAGRAPPRSHRRERTCAARARP